MVYPNSNPLCRTSRKSNQHTAMCVRLHFNVYGVCLGSFSAYRGVGIDTSMGSTVVKKHMCRATLLTVHGTVPNVFDHVVSFVPLLGGKFSVFALGPKSKQFFARVYVCYRYGMIK